MNLHENPPSTTSDSDGRQEPHIPGVEEVTRHIKELLERQFTEVIVRGEVSGYKVSGNGHAYFDCKEGNAKLSCVIWRGTRSRLQMMGLEPSEGQEIILNGSIQLYAPHGSYQLVVESVQTSGVGALYEQLEKLKQKLKEEGLFDSSRKRVLPSYPMSIGVITSSSGAALYDITSTLEARWPLCTVHLAPSRVQGEGAAKELIQGLRRLQELPGIELIILGRGGGSIQDLWEFNNEDLAREIASCKIPVISAVGHETDISISDLVADVRAATPTQAAVFATPHIDDIRQFVEDQTMVIRYLLDKRLSDSSRLVKQLSESYALRALTNKLQTTTEQVRGYQKRLELQKARFDSTERDIQYRRNQISERIQQRLLQKKELLNQLILQLESGNPESPLEKGYVRVMQGETWVRHQKNLNTKQEVRLVWKDGDVKASLNSTQDSF